jgi:hypothetical protein
MELVGRMLTAAVVAAVLLLLASTSSEAAATHGKCQQRGTTVAKNEVARLFWRGGTLYSCLWSANRAEEIASDYDDGGYTFSYGWSGARLAGRYVAWLEWETDISCKAACPPDYDSTTYRVNVIDLRTEESEWTGGLPAGSTLRVNRRGAAAWLESLGGGQREVHAWDADGHRVLDTGVIPRASYSLAGHRLSWANGDLQRTVTLR